MLDWLSYKYVIKNLFLIAHFTAKQQAKFHKGPWKYFVSTSQKHTNVGNFIANKTIYRSLYSYKILAVLSRFFFQPYIDRILRGFCHLLKTVTVKRNSPVGIPIIEISNCSWKCFVCNYLWQIHRVLHNIIIIKYIIRCKRLYKYLRRLD